MANFCALYSIKNELIIPQVLKNLIIYATLTYRMEFLINCSVKSAKNKLYFL